ncbi:hypothetical protein O6H91_17G043600 [Diphasiastrum complanatum]|uniref:Uncharacterized protein n=1 Tax=Diphasiastrum complanatum TaxID=34168 RepID=A0ACC2B671_DIPCM|nr:hypothetical protein O6H91_17G043600 [Diphasiastrum complanatum]
MVLAFLRSTIKAAKDNGWKAALEEVKKQGLVATKLWTDDGARLVGVDKLGNKYFEKKVNSQFGRHRWVEYADKKQYNASAVPPEWHGWLHYITDHTPEQLEDLKPARYGIEHKLNRSGEGDAYIYHSKGHALNPKQRNWTRYEPWQPT